MISEPVPPPLPWISVAPNAPYFIIDTSQSWTPIGQNDAITWPDLSGAFRQKDLVAVEGHFRWLVAHGVTCLRLMLEYCQGENRYLEKPVGYFQPNMVQLWDDIFALCEKYDLRILLTPYDTFWMWRRWSHHPYNQSNGGPCAKRTQWLNCLQMRQAIKNRLLFATGRWGSSGVLFGWDLWNEIRPSHGGNSTKHFTHFINDISQFLRQKEIEIHGRSHLQTVSVFSPTLQQHQHLAEIIYRNPALDFATIHLYEQNTIDSPRNTVDAAIATGRLTREMIKHLHPHIPFFDSEHGPIKSYSRNHKGLKESFDDEYFRHMQWAHFASGGAGGGMRWPYRQPHVLTHGMRKAQLALSKFLPFIDWPNFQRRNINEEIEVTDAGIKAFGCADEKQAIIWLLRTNAKGKDRLVKKEAKAAAFQLHIPVIEVGNYKVVLWNTSTGEEVEHFKLVHQGRPKLLVSMPPVHTDLAIAIRKVMN